MFAADWIETFVKIYNVEAAIPLILFCLLALVKIRKMDKDLLRARFFLNNIILHRTWIFILIGMIFLALNILIKFTEFLEGLPVIEYPDTNDISIELTQIASLTAFSLAAYNCYLFIGTQNQSIKDKALDK
jgi:hypothetical protein